MDYRISLRARDDDGFFTVAWSPAARADKYEIVRGAPAMGGIVELFYKDPQGRLELFCLQRSWYGGIRAMARERSDASLEKDPYRLSVLVKWRDRIYYRWSLSESRADLDDVMFFLAEVANPGGRSPAPSGRFARIFLQEIEAGAGR